MKVIVVESYEELSKKAAELLAEVVENNSRATLGLATGTTPIGCYELLADFCAQKRVSFKNVKAVNLDEYVGLCKSDSQSYAYFMRDKLFDHIDIDLNNTYIPDGMAGDLEGECARYSEILDEEERDVQILGLGSNGHIGFNEPRTSFQSVTHIVDLQESTIKDNARLFDSIEQVPRKAITMGISEIMKAKQIIMLASGANKAQAVHDMVQGVINDGCPASILQTHPNCIVVVDKEAARLLDK